MRLLQFDPWYQVRGGNASQKDSMNQLYRFTKLRMCVFQCLNFCVHKVFAQNLQQKKNFRKFSSNQIQY